MDIRSKVLTTDILVVGAGMAGCFAANRAKELGADVLLIEQGKSGFSGKSVFGTQSLRVFHPDDDFDAAMEATVKESLYMIDQEYAAVVIRDTWHRFQDLLKLGVNFRTDDSGKIEWYFEDTLCPDFKIRHAMWEPMGTYRHLLKVKTEAVRRGVRVLDRICVAGLLFSDGKVRGAVGFHTREGEFYVFKAKAVVLATSSFGGGGGNRYPNLMGDGMAMALRAGAELRGMEWGKAEVGALLPPGGGPNWVYRLFSPQEEEVTITNALGEEFLEKYELGKRVPWRKYYGPPWRIHLMAILKECREGRGPCYIDYRAPNKASRLREHNGSFNDRNLYLIRKSGLTLDKIKYELGLGPGSCLGGGIRINVNAESTIPGLCAAGVTSDVGCAYMYTIPCAMAAALATGYKAGESAVKYALEQPRPVIDEEQVDRLKREIYAPLGRKQGITPDEIQMKIMDAWLNIDIRNEECLNKAREDLEELDKETSKLVAEDYHELRKCHRIKNYILCSQAVANAALIRRETRLDHIREDYPLTDNKEWLKWVIVRYIGDKLQTHLEDIPLERWKYKPEPTVVNELRLRQGV